MEGVQYIVESHKAEPELPTLTVIAKVFRQPKEVRKLAYYYIVSGEIFRAPSLMAVLDTRLVSSRRGDIGSDLQDGQSRMPCITSPKRFASWPAMSMSSA
jgi:hypothetical protein